MPTNLDLATQDPLTVPDLSADQNDWGPDGGANAATWYIGATQAVNVTGMAGGSANKVRHLVNTKAYTITLKAQSSSSLAANRFLTPTDIALPAGATITFRYVVGTSTGWAAAIDTRTALSAAGPPCTINPLDFTGGTILSASNQTVYTRVAQGAATACSKIRLYLSASSGNICVAVYAAGDVPATQVATSGSVASPGTGIREIAISPSVDIYPGMWIAVAADNTTVAFGRSGAPGLPGNAMGTGFQYYQSSTFPAPSTAAPTSASFQAGFILIGVP